MKYVIVIPDGVADEPQTEIGGRTPLAAANVPYLQELAQRGLVGRANHTPAELPAGSDVANLSLFGYSPLENFTGRAPIEAAAQNIDFGPDDWVVRCNLVTIDDQVMKSFTAGHISTEEATALLATAQQQVDDKLPVRFYPGVSYRNLMIWKSSDTNPAPFTYDTRSTPPHDLTEKSVADSFPRGPGSNLLSSLMADSVEWFRNHRINEQRISKGNPPATNIWLWGLGKRPILVPFVERFGVRGAMITAVDLLRGLAQLLGWSNIRVPGATGYIDTNYAAKGRYAVEALETHDLVVVHVEATDEASHEGRLDHKISALESIDEHIVGPLYQALSSRDEPWRMLVTPDHPTLLRTRTHSHGDVPFLVAGSDIRGVPSGGYNEETAAKSDLAFDKGWLLMPWFLSSGR